MTASDIRDFFRSLFGSRYIMRLEEDLLRLRQDYDERLRDKDIMIADLRAEKAALMAKVTIYETTLMPLASKAGADVVASTKPKKPNWGLSFSEPPTMTRWQQIEADWNNHLAEEEAKEAEAAKGQANG